MILPERGGAGTSSLRFLATAIVLVGLFPLVCFRTALDGGFLMWDDNVNLIENPVLWQSTPRALQWMFTDIESVQRYKPLTWLAWHLLGQTFGLNATVFHALNLLVHSCNAVLLFRVIREFLAASVSQTGPSAKASLWAALAGTLWWALHPLRVEPIAWISGAGYPLATFFALLAVLTFQRHLHGGKSRSYWLAVLFFGLSLLSYPAAAALPGLLLALAWLKGLSARVTPGLSIRRLGCLILPFCVLAAMALGATLAVRITTTSEIWGQSPSLEIMSPGSRVMQAFAVWGWYLEKTLLPLHLAPVYPDFWIFSPLGVRAIASVIAIVLISVVAWRIRRSYPEAFAFWGAFLFLAVPVLGLTEDPFSPSDRYSYVPALAFAFFFAALLHQGLVAFSGQKIIFGATAIIIGGCFATTVRQLQVWRNPAAFFNCAISSVGFRPGAANLHWRLGLHYLSAQQTAQAVAEFETVLRLDPSDADAARYVRILKARPAPVSDRMPRNTLEIPR